jgi:acyl-CoA synthetase (AMP-forming)/AMP-acid ligase II
MGLIGGILQPLYGGFPVFLMSPVDFLQQPFRWLQAISHYRGTTSGAPNFAYDLVCRKVTPEQLKSLDLSCWKVAFSGAETVREKTMANMTATFASCGFRRESFYPCYGMAETTLIVSGGTVESAPRVQAISASSLQENKVEIAGDEQDTCQLVACGKSVGNHQIRIADPQSLTSLRDKQVGEIWVRGASVARGYWNQPEEVQKPFHSYFKDTGEGPFLRTGDLGFLHEGELFITGRIKDVIIIGGQNYYPQDIELAVQNSHPSLRPNAGAAFSIEGKVSELLVVIQEVQRSYLRKLDVEEVIGSIRQALTAEYNLQLHAVVLVKPYSIPTTSSGKIRRFACRDNFLNSSFDVVGDWSANPRNRAKYVHLKAEIDSLLTQLETVSSGSKPKS